MKTFLQYSQTQLESSSRSKNSNDISRAHECSKPFNVLREHKWKKSCYSTPPSRKKEAKNEVMRLFNDVKIPTPDETFNKYPHEISGGQQQRVMIAMAIACKPDILIADEPTTALDVTVQKDIIALLKSLQKESKMSVIFISHDLALVSEIADRILVMYKGNIVESGTTKSVFKTPKEDYTKALIGARPTLKSRLKRLPYHQ